LRAELKAQGAYAGLASCRASEPDARGEPLRDDRTAPRVSAQVQLFRDLTFRDAGIERVIRGVTKASWYIMN